MSVALTRTIAETRALVATARAAGLSIGCVPTMGALHAGHAALVDRARAECGFVCVTVFVNPIQFDRAEDYERYARTLDADLGLCSAHGADAVFAPAVTQMYPHELKTTVDVKDLSAKLCGEFRPGHFTGVATVVAKLFNIVQPDRAYFGEKDAQQLAVIARMAADLDFPVEIVPVPTVREADGLALSSRNLRLSETERRAAPALYRALCAACAAIQSGVTDPAAVRQQALEVLAAEPLFRPEYIEAMDPATMQPLGRIEGPVRIAAAAWLGSTRLIDNVLCLP